MAELNAHNEGSDNSTAASLSALTTILSRLLLTIEERLPPPPASNLTASAVSSDDAASQSSATVSVPVTTTTLPVIATDAAVPASEAPIPPTVGGTAPVALVAGAPPVGSFTGAATSTPALVTSAAATVLPVTTTTSPAIAPVAATVLPSAPLVPPPVNATVTSTTTTTAQTAAAPVPDGAATINAPVTPAVSRALPPPITPSQLAALVELRPNPPGAKWYIVSAGTEPGIYPNWYETHPHVNGVPGSSARKVGTREAALDEYTVAYNSGNIFRR